MQQLFVKPRLDPRGMFYLSLIYFFWGSTYLAIRIVVTGDTPIPPYLLGFMRTCLAGVILLLWSGLKDGFKLPDKKDWGLIVFSGLLIWVGGNGFVNWAEQRSESGYAALLVGALPIWMAIMESIVDKRLPSFRLMIAIFIGFAGLFVLAYPTLQSGSTADILSIIALLLAPLFWGGGSLWFQRRKPNLTTLAGAGWQQLAGAIGFLFVSQTAGEPIPTPNHQTWLGFGYLVVAGSIIAYPAYLAALRRLPMSIITTYAYVNPIVALFLGWLLLDETITLNTVLGTTLILLGVAGVFNTKR